MKYLHKTKLETSHITCGLPKDFIFKVLGFLLEDLESVAAETNFDLELEESLQYDFKIVRDYIRNRDFVGLVSLQSELKTQSILLVRERWKDNEGLAFYLSYQLGAFLKKYPFSGIDTKTPAIKKFIAAERSCSFYNQQGYRSLVRLNDTFMPLFSGCLDAIRDDIEKLLGEFPDIDRVVKDATHGPGVSLGLGYRCGKTTSYYKWSTLPYSVTKDALPLARYAIESDPRWIGALDDWYRTRTDNRFAPIDLDDFWSKVFTVKSGSRVTTVPKTALTDRTIAIEPLLNVFLQLGVDRQIRRKLLRWDIDINSQKENQQLAQLGALDGSYATIDLSAASDTVSLKICEMLLPEAWYGLLLDLRSPTGDLNGLRGSFGKISSMGNGYTFALETLIFAAITRHVMRVHKESGKIAVFGDDIVVPSSIGADLISFLGLCGFSTNKEKSFLTGPFRESCGSDWFLRHYVRPVFLTSKCSTVMDLFYIHNSLFQQEETLEWSWGVHFERTRRYIRKYIPKMFSACAGPPSEVLDAYLFSYKRIPYIRRTQTHMRIIAKPRKFNGGTEFFFRKLMTNLSGRKVVRRFWEKRQSDYNSGNAFDVTRRSAIRYEIVPMVRQIL